MKQTAHQTCHGLVPKLIHPKFPFESLEEVDRDPVLVQQINGSPICISLFRINRLALLL